VKLRPPAFIGDLDTRLIDEFDEQHRLLAPFGFYSQILGAEIIVPAGFVTDFASVPRIVGAYLLFGGKGKRAAVIHDWLYTLGKLDPITWAREKCDAIFREALIASGYSAVTVGAMYAGVRVGGGAYFDAPNLDQPAHVAAVMGAGALVAN
jgi:hypothetical protein